MYTVRQFLRYLWLAGAKRYKRLNLVFSPPPRRKGRSRARRSNRCAGHWRVIRRLRESSDWSLNRLAELTQLSRFFSRNSSGSRRLFWLRSYL